MENEKRLFLLDAYALIFRAYYALIKMPRINREGFNTSAIFGFVNTLEELLRKERPTHIAVCFDPPGGSFRSQAYADYKGERPSTPEDIKLSVPIIKEIIEAYRIPIVEKEGFEADDVIGSMAKRAEAEGFTVYMMTPDKDFGQLVTPNVLQYKPSYRGQDFEIRGPEEIKARYGLQDTRQVIDLLALMGDKADNIPGCPGIGDVTARKLLAQYGDVEHIIAAAPEMKGANRRKIEENSEQIVFSKFLATIRTDVPLDITPSELTLRTPDRERLFDIFRRLEFRQLADRVRRRLDNQSGEGRAESGEGAAASAAMGGAPVPRGAKGDSAMPSLFDFIDSEDAAPAAVGGGTVPVPPDGAEPRKEITLDSTGDFGGKVAPHGASTSALDSTGIPEDRDAPHSGYAANLKPKTYDLKPTPAPTPSPLSALRSPLKVTCQRGLTELQEKVTEAGEVGVAILTEGDNDVSKRWIATALALPTGDTFSIINYQSSISNPDSGGEMPGEEELRFGNLAQAALLDILAREDILKVTDDAKLLAIMAWQSGEEASADLKPQRNSGAELRNFFDTSLAHYLIQADGRHSLETLAPLYLGGELPAAPATARERAAEPPETALHRLAMRAAAALALRRPLEQEVKVRDQWALLTEIEFPLAMVLARMELTGVRIDRRALDTAARDMQARLDALEAEIHTLAGETFNVGSPSQVGEILFGKMGLDPKAKKTKSGQYSTSEAQLEKVAHKSSIVGKILEYRKLKKLLNTYLTALPEAINPATGRVHTNYNQTVTATGRISSSNPNLQNIPVREEEGREIRRAFIPSEGNLFLSADYSQIELRLVADFAEDPIMLEAFAEGRDIHAATAARIYHKPVEEVTSDERRHAKTANFGILYGITAFGLASRLGIPRGEAKELIDNYFATFPAISRYMAESVEQAREKGYAETRMGRRRDLPDITSRNPAVRGFAERNAVNAPIQGTAADIIKRAMIDIDAEMRRRGMRSRMIMQVHDELNFDAVPGEVPQLQELVTTLMERAYAGRVRLTAECGVGPDWLAAH